MLRRWRHSSRIGAARLAAIGAIVCLAAAGIGAGIASAEPVFRYDVVKGSSTIEKLDATLALGPGKLVVDLEGATGRFTADMQLPPASGSFKIFGLFPTTATVTMIQQGPIVGTITDGVVEADANVAIKLSDVHAVGFPLFVGNNCRTERPAEIHLKSAPGFNPIEGGDLLGTYTIPDFSGCGSSTPVLNCLIPGPSNTISLTLAIRWD
ncbi:hypothetical protein GCM10012275_34880 [Longimycelium tulufanense]|uniref:Uncharacterized protein n=1 Tax=Longimycelium tulufanense TaxID=907463 RepID=A0A8J3FVU2_9PSEU|nr:hypothetical protein [Longimycelium tulufanense]GGM60852.1 hypothetical protein GCM10012275_34880 [Longimycelium tulufanense]